MIDGLLGVGSRGDRCGRSLPPWRPRVNEARSGSPSLRVVAVDVPSGIDADTGAVPGDGGPRRRDGHVRGGQGWAAAVPGRRVRRRLVPKPIGLPPARPSGIPVHVLDEACRRAARAAAPARRPQVQVRAGAGGGGLGPVRRGGLPGLGGRRAGRGRAGRASSRRKRSSGCWQRGCPEATYPLTLSDLDADPEAAADRVAELLPEQAVLLLGPGIGRVRADRAVRAAAAARERRPGAADPGRDRRRRADAAGRLVRLVGADRRRATC